MTADEYDQLKASERAMAERLEAADSTSIFRSTSR